MSKICVVGTGYVGLPAAACFADLGNDVVCIDVVAAKVEKLRNGEMPIYEPGLEEIVHRNMKAGRLYFTTNYEKGVPDADFVFIAVGTPEQPDGRTDMSYVESAAKSIGQHLQGHTVIVNKSTVPIGTGDWVHSLIAEHTTNGQTYAVVSNPEFMREGQAIFDFLNPDRVVIGSSERAAAEAVARLYEPLKSEVLITDLRTAEMIKYASNAILANYISFINQIALMCEQLGADVKQVAKGMSYDKRIAGQFLNAGIGYGGSCFPKDVKSLAMVAKDHGVDATIFSSVIEVNNRMRSFFVEKVTRLLGGSLQGKEVAVWGLSFKPNTDDMREAPSIDIVQGLLAGGATVRSYDPMAMDVAQRILPGLKLCTDAYEAAKNADAVLLLTEWNEFKQLDMERVRAEMRGRLLVDGRNLYEPQEIRELGFEYAGVGRN